MSRASEIGLTILVDNLATEGLRRAHGFSVWIEVARRRILFDTGQGAALMDNAASLGLDLGTIDTLVLSHGHYDHTGGVPVVLAQAPTVEVFVHPASTCPRYSIRNGNAKPISMPTTALAALESHSAGVHWTTRAEQLASGVGITGPIPRLTDYEDTGGPFFLDPCGNEPDAIVDDQALWARTKRGVVVIVGCSHAGLVNTVRHALRLSGETRLHAVLGGFHLAEANERRLTRTMEELQAMNPDLIVPCHCTGNAAVERLEQTFGAGVVKGSAGTVFLLGDTWTEGKR